MSTLDNNFHIWEGVTDVFPESDSEHIWNSDRWVSSVFNSLSVPDADQSVKEAGPSEVSLVHEYPLPPVAALLAVREDSLPLRILDFGGGNGASFLTCVHSLPDPVKIEYHIVEGEKICEKGQSVYARYKNLFYHRSLPVCERGFHIVHTAATLHYIRDWRSLLKKLVDYHPEILMLNALNAGDIKTFVSFQNYYGEKIPVWFWNIHEITGYVQSLGYRLVYQSLLEFSFLGEKQPLPMQNFSPEYRLSRKCNLLFSLPT